MPLPRTALASIVCPSTPFLLPRLLRAPASLATLTSTCAALQRPAYSTKAKFNARKALRRGPQLSRSPLKEKENDILNSQLPTVEKFQQACAERDVTTMMDLYPNIVGSPLITREHTRRIAQAIHAFLRSRPDRKSTVHPFLTRIIPDICSGTLPPHPHANRHLLSTYKELKWFEEGTEFWQWLSEQDDSFIDPSVYGAAIELLAYQGSTRLQELEDLYAYALKRFPGTFAEYHLSPEAIVPDRSQPLSIPGIPMTLLQGILTARVLARDWKNAYLAFDTALRLHPADLPHRFFELFMTERPISEGYTIFLMACRSGILFKPTHLTNIIMRLRKELEATESLQARIMLIQGMSNAIYAYLQSGGTIQGPHVGSFLNALGTLLPTPVEQEVEDGQAKIRNLIAMSAHQIASELLQAGMSPHPQVFTALISLAGRLRIRTLLESTLNDIETSRLDLSPIDRRIILLAAGDLQDQEVIKRYWYQIAATAEKEATQIARVDWLTLASVCRRAGCEEFARDQLQWLKHAITTENEGRFVKELTSDQHDQLNHAITSMDPDTFNEEITVIHNHIKNIAAVVMSGQPLDLHQSPFYMSLDPTKAPLGSVSDLRTLYDEFTTDPHQPEPRTDSHQVSLSRTGIPLAELRYENWVSIVGLMDQAEETEILYQHRITEAIGREIPLQPTSTMNFSSSQGQVDDLEVPYEGPLPLPELRSKIKSLRAPASSHLAEAGEDFADSLDYSDESSASRQTPIAGPHYGTTLARSPATFPFPASRPVDSPVKHD